MKDVVSASIRDEFTKAMLLVDGCLISTTFSIASCNHDKENYASYKDNLENLLRNWTFSVSKSALLNQSDKNPEDELDPKEIGALAECPTRQFLLVDQMLQDLQDKYLPKSPDEESTAQRSSQAIGKQEVKAKHFSSLRHMNASLTDGRNRPSLLDSKHMSNKNSVFESVFQPTSVQNAETSTKLFDFDIESVPDPSDSNFNNFLESELNRIKKAFLDDNSSTAPHNIESQSKKNDFSHKTPTVELKNSDLPTRSKSTKLSKGTPSVLKKCVTHLSYKEKFEELYYKGANLRKSSEPKRRASKPLCNVQVSTPSIQEEIKSVTDASKVLSKYSVPHGNKNQLHSFSPLFKAH